MDATAAPGARPRLVAWAAAAPVSLLLMAANVAAFAWAAAHGGAADPAALVRLGALERSRVWAGEPWRLLTATFLHVGWVHLACNVALGVAVCRLVERALGKARLLVLYLASAAAGSALSLLGQDGVSAGASGALFGMVGAVLALHLRALGGWRAFLRSGATRSLGAGILSTSLVAPLFVPLDHLAHAGGLAAGIAGAWLMSRPPPLRALPWAAFAAALALLVTAAAWPRAALTRFETRELALGIDAALRAGDLDRALGSARRLAGAADPRVRGDALRVVIGAAKTLAYRLYTGDGAEQDPLRALGYMDEACRAGDAESCRNAARVRGE